MILETCDFWDIWSEWWEDMTWPKKQLQRQFWRLVTFETLITILTVENLNLWQSLLPDNLEWQWTVFAILAIFWTTVSTASAVSGAVRKVLLAHLDFQAFFYLEKWEKWNKIIKYHLLGAEDIDNARMLNVDNAWCFDLKKFMLQLTNTALSSFVQPLHNEKLTRKIQ